MGNLCLDMEVQNPPFEDVFPIGNGAFPLPCSFWGSVLPASHDVDSTMVTQGENAPLRCSGLLHAPLLIRRDGLGEATKISVWRKNHQRCETCDED